VPTSLSEPFGQIVILEATGVNRIYGLLMRANGGLNVALPSLERMMAER